MYKKLQTKFLALLAIMLMGGSSAWAETKTATLSNANIVADGSPTNSYATYSITDGNGKTWNAYAIKNYHSKATSDYHYLQIKKYASNTAYYLQVPEYGTKITSITMTVSSSSKPMTDGGNSATLYFSSSNETSAAGTGVASGTGASSVTIDCSSLNLNTGYITASGAVRIWDVTITYEGGSTSPVITANDVNITYDATSGSIEYTINNEVEGGSVSAAVTQGNWLTLIQETASPITFTCSANSETTDRTAIVTLTYTYNTNEIVTKDVTITQDAYVAPFESATYTLANSITSGKHYIIASSKTDGTAQAMGAQSTNNRPGTAVTVLNNAIQTTSEVAEFVICGPDADGNYTIYDAAEGGYLYAASSSSNHLKTQKTLNDNGRWSISFGEDGEANIVAQGTNTRNTMRYNSNSGNSLFSCYASGQSDVYLYEKADEATPTQAVSISDAGMATLSSENALDFTNVDAIHAYYVNVDNSGNLTFTRIRKIPANTGVLLRNAQGEDQGAVETINVPVLSGEAESVEGNAFVAVLEEIAQLESNADGFNNYILNKKDGRLGFYHANKQKVGAGKAYLRIDESIQAREFFGFNEGEATSISTIDNGQLTMENAYNLQGQKVGSEYKGIVIVNGKKFINK